MQRSGRLNRGIGLTALCILLLSVLNTTFAAPIARDEDGATALVARGDSNVYEVSYTDDNGKTTKTWYQHNSQIGKDEYKTYLNFNYKNKDKCVQKIDLSVSTLAVDTHKEAGISCSLEDPRTRFRSFKRQIQMVTGITTRT